MATRRLRRKHNQTRKRKNIKKGGSVQCIYDKPSKKLHITIARGILDGNLSAIRSACEQAIKESSPEKAVKESSPELAVKKSSSKKASSQAHGNKKSIFDGFPTSESLTSDRGVYDGRREDSV
jgi:hypothetical protein